MLIYIVPTSYPNPDNPVANAFVEEQAIALSKIPGNRVVVLNVQKQPSAYFFKPIQKKIGITEKNNVTIVHVKHKTLSEKHFILSNQFAFNRAMKKLYRYAVRKYGKPDILYAHFYSAAYAAIKMEKKIPVVLLEHSGELMQSKIDVRSRYILKKVVLHTEEYLATTDYLKNKVLCHTKTTKPIRVLPNIVDDRFQYYPKAPKSENFVYFALGRLEYDKRLDLLIDAFLKAHGQNQNVQLFIGGDGKEYSALKKQIAERKCEETVKLLGRLDRDAALKQMRACDCFVLPSRHETFGLVWREALCVGRPVITTDHGGFGTTDWKKEYGVMVPVDNEKQLTDAIMHVFHHYHQYNLANISLENRQRYAASVIMEELMTIFKKILA